MYNRFKIAAVIVFFLVSFSIRPQAQTGNSTGKVYDPVPSLKEAFRDDFLIGTALNMSQVEERDPAVSALISKQFSTFTPENNMKGALIQPGWDRYNFEQADEIVRFAAKYNMKINAHCLIWHSQLPSFMAGMKDADSVRHYFTDHITTVAGR